MLDQTPTPSADEFAAAPPDVLTLMLFEGAVRFGRRARHAIDAGHLAEGVELVSRVRAIVRQLDASLNHDAGEISGHLSAIYEYLLRRLAVAVEEADALDEVVRDLQELAIAWSAVAEGCGAEVGPAAVAG